MDYFALALKLGVSIWSNDKLLKGQEAVEVLNTMEVMGFWRISNFLKCECLYLI
ncbi:MAG: hypothetical protein KJ592_03675 [Nanoarchaeota archaeon]|nr:hypothetical protein [Nanoarchaeota archaeon]